MRRQSDRRTGTKERAATDPAAGVPAHGSLSARASAGVHGAGRVRLGAQRHLKAHQGAPEAAKRVPVWAQSPAAHISR